MAEICICDDNELDRWRLKTELESLAKRFFLDISIREFESADLLWNAWESAQARPALVFLDIFMDGTDGIQLARKLRETGSTVPIIFTTSSEHHGVDAFSVFAGGYLMKPYTRAELYSAARPYMERMAAEARFCLVTVRRAEQKLPLWKILYLEADGHVTYIHTNGETLKCGTDIGDFRRRLAEESAFMECGKSYLVNLFYVKQWEGNAITMQDGSEVYMPQRLSTGLKKHMEEFLNGHGLSL